MRIIITSLLLGLFCNLAVAQTSNDDYQLLWEISGNGLKQKSYLFGSFHSNDKRIFKFTDSMYFALKNTEALILETDIYELFDNLDVRKRTANMFYDNEGNPYTSSKKASKTSYGDEDGMPQFLDAYFLQYAYNTDKQFYPLETVEYQMNLLNDFPAITPTFTTFEAVMISQERILNVYLTGDIYKIDKLMRTSFDVYPGLYERLIIERNDNMAKGIDSIVQLQPTFCAVGAGHLAGKEGVINLLREKGYRLRPVRATYSKEPIAEKKEVLASRNYHYSDSITGLNILFPGKPLEVDYLGDRRLVYREFGQGNSYIIDIIPVDSTQSLEELADIYLVIPQGASYEITVLDDGTNYAQGITDTYPEGLVWTRILMSDKYAVIIKTYGGNKFMNSNRPETFFNRVWFE